MFKFPFSNLHELNLDWILEQVKQFSVLIPPMETAVEDVQALQDDVAQAVTDAQTAVEQANTAAETAAEALEVAEQAAAGTIADGAVTTDKLANSAVTNPKIADGTITGVKLADGAIYGAKIADQTILASKLAEGSVTSEKILDGTIQTVDIADNAITNVKMADNSVNTAELVNGAVTTEKLHDGSVTPVKVPGGTFTFTENDIDNVIQTLWGVRGEYWGKLSQLFLSVRGECPSSSNWHTIGTIPALYSPPNDTVEATVPSATQNIAISVQINTDGTIKLRNNSGTTFSSTIVLTVMYFNSVT